MSVLFAMKWSVIGFGVSLALGLLSMGALGAALYYTCYPIFSPFYGNLNDWSGDWVWPATIFVGMLWSISFLVAGFLNLQLGEFGTQTWVRVIACIFVLWAGAALTWAVVLWTQYQPPTVLDEGAVALNESAAKAMECERFNSSYVERALATAYNATPRLLDGTRCLKNASDNDIVAMGELDASFSPQGVGFEPADVTDEAPLDLVEVMYPEAFYGLPRSNIQIASRFSNELRINVHLLRIPNGRLFVLVSDTV